MCARVEASPSVVNSEVLGSTLGVCVTVRCVGRAVEDDPSVGMFFVVVPRQIG